LADGRILDKSLLDKAEQELTRQYFNRGMYAVQVKANTTPLERNRVAVNFEVNEGEVAKIRSINIVGAKAFPKKPAQTVQSENPRHDDLVEQERSVLQAKTVGRSGNLALALPESGLSGIQRRIDPGIDHAGQEGHLHHHQYPGR
jgi:outer membrane protein assembly factor BamA